jgi:[ribosomal protein S18]-alanine N-acetyltransferase
MSSAGGKIQIRPVNFGDSEAIHAIAATVPEAPHWSRSQYLDTIRGDGLVPRIVLGAFDSSSEEMIGFVVASLVPPEAELESIAVAANRQRQRVGSRLLAVLIHQLKLKNVQELFLEVRSSNLSAIRFYQSENFKSTGVRAGYYAEPKEDAVLMSLHLA